MDRAAAKDRETFCSVKDKKHSPKEKPQPISRGLTLNPSRPSRPSFANFAVKGSCPFKPEIKSL
jgi:hypothetical protein